MPGFAGYAPEAGMTEKETLERRWRQELRRIVDLAVRRYGLDDDDPRTRPALTAYESELAAHRRTLSAIEARLLEAAR
jgi:hypothetical protein